MTDILPLPGAVAELIHDGDTVAMEGFTRLIPFAVAREVIRQGITDLTLVRMTSDVIYDLPLSIGDVELAETTGAVVSVPEVFNCRLQGGRLTSGSSARPSSTVSDGRSRWPVRSRVC